MAVVLKEGTLEKVRELLPIPLEGRDLDFIVDWLVWVGLSMAKMTMKKHPGMTLGHLMNLTIGEKERFN